MTKDEDKLQKFLQCTDSKKSRIILESLDDWALAGLVIWKEVNKTQENLICKKLPLNPEEVFLKQWKNKKIPLSQLHRNSPPFKNLYGQEIQVVKHHQNVSCRSSYINNSFPEIKNTNCKDMKRGDLRLSIKLQCPNNPWYLSRGEEHTNIVTYHYCVYCTQKQIKTQKYRYNLIKTWWSEALASISLSELTQTKTQTKAQLEIENRKDAKKSEEKKSKTAGSLNYLAEVFTNISNTKIQKMSSIMKKGEVSNDILAEILWMYLFHEDSTVRKESKKAFLKLAPQSANKVVKKNWKAAFRNDFTRLQGNRMAMEPLSKNLSVLGKKLEKTPISIIAPLTRMLEGDDYLLDQLGLTCEFSKCCLSCYDYIGVAAMSLCKIGDKRTIKSLIKALEEGSDYPGLGRDAKSAIVNLLSKFGHKVK